jgi:hypothetical protein
MFKVGDKVRAVKPWNVVKQGDTGKVEKIKDEIITVKWDRYMGDIYILNGFGYCVIEEVLELLQPATLTTGQMIDALQPGQRYGNERGTVSIIKGELTWDDGTNFLVTIPEFGFHGTLNDQWTLLPEPPKEVPFMEAVKAYSEGKTIYCKVSNLTFTYYEKHDYNGCYQLLAEESMGGLSAKEILEGIWIIKEG